MTLQLNEICEENNDEDIRRALRSLPRGLNETYARILARIFSQRKPDIAKKILKWVIGARRPLSLDELAEAISLEPTDTLWAQCRDRFPNSKPRMIQNCGSLLTVAQTETSQIVQFAHYTVVEFLQSPAATAHSGFQILIREANIHIGRLCLMYLSLPDFETQITIAPKKSALEKSPIGWVPRMFQSNSVTRVLWDATTKVLWGNPTVPPVDVQTVLRYTMNSSSPLDTLKREYRLLDYVTRYWLDHCAELSPESQEHPGRSWELFTELTLRKSHLGDIPWTEENPDGLHYAAQFRWGMMNGHSALVRLIMDEAGSGFTTYDTLFGPSPAAFHQSWSLGHDAIAGLYLDRYRKLCDINRSLRDAVEGCHWNIIERLLEAGVDVDAAEKDGSTALHIATRNDNLVAVERLLQAGANVNATDKDGSTALHMATRSCYLSAIERLLQAGADVNATEKDGLTVLNVAARMGHLGVIKRLLEADDATGDVLENTSPPAATLPPTKNYAPPEGGITTAKGARSAHPKQPPNNKPMNAPARPPDSDCDHDSTSVNTDVSGGPGASLEHAATKESVLSRFSSLSHKGSTSKFNASRGHGKKKHALDEELAEEVASAAPSFKGSLWSEWKSEGENEDEDEERKGQLTPLVKESSPWLKGSQSGLFGATWRTSKQAESIVEDEEEREKEKATHIPTNTTNTAITTTPTIAEAYSLLLESSAAPPVPEDDITMTEDDITMTRNDITMAEDASNASPKQRPGDKRRMYAVHTSPETLKEWHSVTLPRLESTLQRLANNSKIPVRPMTIDLLGIGTSRETSQTTIVVTCHPAAVGLVRTYLKKKFTYDTNTFELKVRKGGTARRSSGWPYRMRLANRAQGSHPTTISNQVYQQRPSSGASIGACRDEKDLPPGTFGGVIAVDGMLYGLTCHHLLDPLTDDEYTEEADNEESESYSSSIDEELDSFSFHAEVCLSSPNYHVICLAHGFPRRVRMGCCGRKLARARRRKIMPITLMLWMNAMRMNRLLRAEATRTMKLRKKITFPVIPAVEFLRASVMHQAIFPVSRWGTQKTSS